MNLYYVIKNKGLKALFATNTNVVTPETLKTKYTTDDIFHIDVSYCLELASILNPTLLRQYRNNWGLSIRLKVVSSNVFRIIVLLNEASGIIQHMDLIPERMQRSRNTLNNLKLVSLDDFLVTDDDLPLKPVEVCNAIIQQLDFVRGSLQSVSVVHSKHVEYYGRQLTHLLGDVEAVLIALLEVQHYAETKPTDNRATEQS